MYTCSTNSWYDLVGLSTTPIHCLWLLTSERLVPLLCVVQHLAPALVCGVLRFPTLATSNAWNVYEQCSTHSRHRRCLVSTACISCAIVQSVFAIDGQRSRVPVAMHPMHLATGLGWVGVGSVPWMGWGDVL